MKTSGQVRGALPYALAVVLAVVLVVVTVNRGAVEAARTRRSATSS